LSKISCNQVEIQTGYFSVNESKYSHQPRQWFPKSKMPRTA